MRSIRTALSPETDSAPNPPARLLIILVLAVSVLVVTSCGEREATSELLALRSACFPADGEGTYLVAPGLFQLLDGQEGQIEASLNDGVAPADFEVFVALGGVVAGDATELTDAMDLQLVSDADLVGPGEWPIVYTFSPAGKEFTFSVTGIELTIDGARLKTSERFDVTVRTTC